MVARGRVQDGVVVLAGNRRALRFEWTRSYRSGRTPTVLLAARIEGVACRAASSTLRTVKRGLGTSSAGRPTDDLLGEMLEGRP